MMMKKIALAVNYDYHDYGGMLQAFATQQALDKIGVESEVVNFDALKVDINRRKWKYFLTNASDFSIVKEKSRVIGKKMRARMNKEFGYKLSARDKAFDDFCRKNFQISKKFGSWKELQDSCHEYEAIIVGSDQLWLPSNVAGDYYTLNFVPDGVKKVAYATSFGVGAIPEKMKRQYSAFLKRIDFLSARETSGQEIIKQCTGRDVPLVCDPTLLLETSDWDKILSREKVPQEEYVFCYFMGDNPEQRDFAKRLARKCNLKIVALLHLDQYIASDEDYVDYAPYNISPADFVGLVKNAKFVCTDSFHGTVFSILFSKDFFTFKRFNKKASLSTNTRLVSLLNRLNLQERLFVGNEGVDNVQEKIDYRVVQPILSAFRESSFEYLKFALL